MFTIYSEVESLTCDSDCWAKSSCMPRWKLRNCYKYFNSKCFLGKLVKQSVPIIHQLPIMIKRDMSSPSFVFSDHSYSGHTIIIEFSCFHERGRCGNEVVSKQIRAWIRARWVSGLW